VSGITFIGYSQYRNIGRPNNLKVFGSNKTKGPKHNNQNLQKSPMPEGGENISFDILLR
jgi:hypothetical protein